jgi:hypothetical protein
MGGTGGLAGLITPSRATTLRACSAGFVRPLSSLGKVLFSLATQMLFSFSMVAKCLAAGLAQPLHALLRSGPLAINSLDPESTAVERPESERRADAVLVASTLSEKLRRYRLSVQSNEFRTPASTRLRGEPRGNVRDVWEDTRLEAMQRLSEHGSVKFADLASADRQSALFDVLRKLDKPPKYPIALTGDAGIDTVSASFCALGYLRDKCLEAGTTTEVTTSALESFLTRCEFAGICWQETRRGHHLLGAGYSPPMMFSIIWDEVTRLSKEIAVATIIGSPLEKAIKRDIEHLNARYAKDSKLVSFCEKIRLQQIRIHEAIEPDDLLTS